VDGPAHVQHRVARDIDARVVGNGARAFDEHALFFRAPGSETVDRRLHGRGHAAAAVYGVAPALGGPGAAGAPDDRFVTARVAIARIARADSAGAAATARAPTRRPATGAGASGAHPRGAAHPRSAARRRAPASTLGNALGATGARAPVERAAGASRARAADALPRRAGTAGDEAASRPTVRASRHSRRSGSRELASSC